VELGDRQILPGFIRRRPDRQGDRIGLATVSIDDIVGEAGVGHVPEGTRAPTTMVTREPAEEEA
jgi:hypothetical protein